MVNYGLLTLEYAGEPTGITFSKKFTGDPEVKEKRNITLCYSITVW